jgi:hypothetical protein
MKGFKKPAANKNVRHYYVGVVCTFTFCHQGKIASDLQLYAWCELTSALRGFNLVRTFFRLLYSFIKKTKLSLCGYHDRIVPFTVQNVLSLFSLKSLEAYFLLLLYY